MLCAQWRSFRIGLNLSNISGNGTNMADDIFNADFSWKHVDKILKVLSVVWLSPNSAAEMPVKSQRSGNSKYKSHSFPRFYVKAYSGI